MAYETAKIVSMADDGSPTLTVQPSEMNFFTLPTVPRENGIWFDVQGTLGQAGSSFTFKIYKSDAWVTVYAIAF